jgi:hypothetical protein
MQGFCRWWRGDENAEPARLQRLESVLAEMAEAVQRG